MDEELLEFVKNMRDYFESFRRDGERPDEWILQEWVIKCDRAISTAESNAQPKAAIGGLK
jgi:hypothetical protein